MPSKSIFIVPCYFDGTNKAVFDCVSSILKHHPDDDILIVDSDSPDRSYFELKNINDHVNIFDIANKNYDAGAYWRGFKAFPDYDFYYLIHDSVKLNTNISHVSAKPFTSMRYFHSFNGLGGRNYIRGRSDAVRIYLDRLFKQDAIPFDAYGFDSEEQRVWVANNLSKIRCFMPEIWISVFGPVFFCANHVMKMLSDRGVMNIFPENKVQQMAMERLLGIFLQQNGIDSTESLIGNHYKNSFENRFISKTIFKRN
jgi:hypothetical protein